LCKYNALRQNRFQTRTKEVIDAKELNGNAKTVLDPLNQDPVVRQKLLVQARNEMEEIAALKKPADDYVLRLAKKWVATIKDISNVQQAINIGERDLNESRALWSKLDGKLEAIAESYIDSKN
jgi:hypothetical protein